MTEKEMGMLMVLISDLWNHFNFIPSDTGKIKLWHRVIGDMDFDIAQRAVYSLANTNTFAPSPAEVRKTAVNIACPGGRIASQEIWSRVYSLVQKYGFRRYDEALEEMDEITRRTVRALGWRNICFEPTDKVERKFLSVYEELCQGYAPEITDLRILEGGV